MNDQLITFTLPKQTVIDTIAKLDTVAGTRQLCNFFEEGVKQVEAKAQAEAKMKAEQKEVPKENLKVVEDEGQKPVEKKK